MTRNDQGKNLVDQLAVLHYLAALRVARLHQHAQNVSEDGRIFSSSIDDLKNDLTESSERARKFHVARRFVGEKIEVEAHLLVSLPENKAEHNLQGHAADVARNIHAFGF